MNKEEFTKQMVDIAKEISQIVERGNYPHLKKVILTVMGMYIVASQARRRMKRLKTTLEQELQKQEQEMEDDQAENNL